MARGRARSDPQPEDQFRHQITSALPPVLLGLPTPPAVASLQVRWVRESIVVRRRSPLCAMPSDIGVTPGVIEFARTQNRKVGGSTPPLATSPASVSAGHGTTSPPPPWPADVRDCPFRTVIGRSMVARRVHAEISLSSRSMRTTRCGPPSTGRSGDDIIKPLPAGHYRRAQTE